MKSIVDHLLPGSNRHAKHASHAPQSLAAEVQLSPLPYCETGPTAATGCPVCDEDGTEYSGIPLLESISFFVEVARRLPSPTSSTTPSDRYDPLRVSSPVTTKTAKPDPVPSRIAPGAAACTWRRGQEGIGPHSLQRDRREGKTHEEG